MTIEQFSEISAKRSEMCEIEELLESTIIVKAVIPLEKNGHYYSLFGLHKVSPDLEEKIQKVYDKAQQEIAAMLSNEYERLAKEFAAIEVVTIP